MGRYCPGSLFIQLDYFTSGAGGGGVYPPNKSA